MDLSILIPARCEMFLGKTIENILENIEGDTEVIPVLDGYLPDPPLPADPRCNLIYHPESVGQRAATNNAAKLSKAKYLMKCDAHCAFDKGFDKKMLEAISGHDDWTMVPLMKNLHAFDWVCPDGHRRYQGPSGPCLECGKETTRDVVWIAKRSPNSVSYCFDSTPHFQYFGDWAKRPEGQGEITPTMSLQGSAWMLTRDKYWELNVCDEAFGSWGSQGIEVAVKTWLSGGSVMVNHKTWYAHMFRTQGGDFGFPYPISGAQQEHAKKTARDLFFNDKWPHQVHPLSWLVEKFWPIKGWTDADLAALKANTFKFSEKPTLPTAESEPASGLVVSEPTKGIIYYPESGVSKDITEPAKEQLTKISRERNMPIKTPVQFKQILAALTASDADIIFFCKAGVFYHPSHFDFVPPKHEGHYYNANVWKVRWSDGLALKADDPKDLSGLCGYRDFLIGAFKKKKKAAVESWKSRFPNIDISNSHNIFEKKRVKSKLKDKKYTRTLTEPEADKIPGWEGFFSRLKNPTKGIIYYSDCQLDEKIAKPVREQILKISLKKKMPIISATLKKMDFGVKNIHFPSLKRGYPAMFKQITSALEHSQSDIIFLCEHDVLYHPSHFKFTPKDRNTFYYNQNVWFLRLADGHALHYDVNQLSGLCGYRDALLTHFRERFERIEKEGFSRKMGFEPMTHGRVKWQNVYKLGTWKSKVPNIDIRHKDNLTGQRWKKDQFRNKKLLKGWVERKTKIPGWGKTKDLIKAL